MTALLKTASALVAVVLVIIELQFNVGNTIVYVTGIISSMSILTIVIYIASDTLREWWNENVKKKSKKQR